MGNERNKKNEKGTRKAGGKKDECEEEGMNIRKREERSGREGGESKGEERRGRDI